MSINATAAASRESARHDSGRFGEQEHSAPEILLPRAGLAVEVPVNDRERNYWVRVATGESVQFDVALDGIAAPGAPLTNDTLTLTGGNDDAVHSVIAIDDDDIGGEVAAALSDLDTDTAEELRTVIRRGIAQQTGGAGDIDFDDNGVTVRHRAAHPLDSDGGVFTSNVMSSLESSASYLYFRDGYYQTTLAAALSAYGYDGT